MREHPYPPVVRWALFPALAGLAGAAGGVLGVSLAGEASATRLIVIGGCLSAGAGLASMLSSRAWICLLGAPILGVLTASTGVAVVEALERGGAIRPWVLLTRILQDARGLVLVGWVPLAQTIVHRTTSIRGWRPGVALATGFGLLSFALTALLAPRGAGMLPVGATLALSICAQVPAVVAAVAVARRLRPPEAA
ncbi:MAG TPA: hypothetical protein VF950_29005 [Planctomycetota bacterium]